MQNSINKEKFKVIIAGGRNFYDYTLLKNKCNDILKNKIQTHEIIIISGTAYGADKLGERYAKEMGFDLILKPADWDTYGKGAGYRRNVEMAEIADALIAFWDEKSKGTQHMINIAKNKNILTRIINY